MTLFICTCNWVRNSYKSWDIWPIMPESKNEFKIREKSSSLMDDKASTVAVMECYKKACIKGYNIYQLLQWQNHTKQFLEMDWMSLQDVPSPTILSSENIIFRFLICQDFIKFRYILLFTQKIAFVSQVQNNCIVNVPCLKTLTLSPRWYLPISSKFARSSSVVAPLSFWRVNKLNEFSLPRNVSSSSISTAIIQLGLWSNAIYKIVADEIIERKFSGQSWFRLKLDIKMAE